MTAPASRTPSDCWRNCASQTFDLLILDWNMPELSGIETLRRIDEMLPPRRPCCC
jgi:CheY-like chemotaxis protein